MFKRIVLFLATNLAILVVISFILSLFNIGPYLTQYGLNYQALLIYAGIIGFTGAFISLFISKWMAIHAFNVQIIDKPKTEAEFWLMKEIRNLSQKRNIGMPDVGIYDSPEPNAFATGWNKNKALVAVSSGLLNTMNEEELQGVLGHELAHVANGDMVTLTLIQGVVNTFVIFFARVAAFLVMQFFRRDDEEGVQGGFVYYSVALIFELLFGILASLIVMWFSRYREFRADRGSAEYVGRDKMIKALYRLQELEDKTPRDERAPAFNTMKISDKESWLALFSSHPPLKKRIEALQQY
ncbi:protease HtpX [Fluoribacter dumoffii]|uniref:Protease HtpX n=1 Tax=Fluoribacter dumoffii TaxID=463 RepID=A0A377G781_9GAMM|nr:protease HtpX [Fluoribacter dumoffii]KTC89555.1 M48 family peptidase [Fluoribacter dumoffii NY 23]MCW8384749.1 protease HtpX [Fluoribacter dumoffii]MCW8417812.1 protease HtpX [Fluoribacter dumoffii]MCW8454346.1 protease HtpX [Fluoribacter dumoffii]MCW8461580.1 protease HtpX [Fluoribacter dumoffii]